MALSKKTDFHIGEKFNRLQVLSFSHKKGDRYFLSCICDCGNQSVIREDSLKNGHAKSCGCIAKEALSLRTSTHGMTDSRTYNIWKAMKHRCSGASKDERAKVHYFEKGIIVCDKWKEFPGFLEDMGEAPDGLSIDRKNNDAGYNKENCRWATPKQQMNNTSRNRMLTANGVTRTLSEWADILGCKRSVIGHRIGKLGWDVEKAVSTPAGIRRKT
jgi:hypothetical protein